MFLMLETFALKYVGELGNIDSATKMFLNLLVNEIHTIQLNQLKSITSRTNSVNLCDEL